MKGIDNLDTAVIDEDLIGGALVEEADGDQHISSMTTFELAQVKHVPGMSYGTVQSSCPRPTRGAIYHKNVNPSLLYLVVSYTRKDHCRCKRNV